VTGHGGANTASIQVIVRARARAEYANPNNLLEYTYYRGFRKKQPSGTLTIIIQKQASSCVHSYFN